MKFFNLQTFKNPIFPIVLAIISLCIFFYANLVFISNATNDVPPQIISKHQNLSAVLRMTGALIMMLAIWLSGLAFLQKGLFYKIPTLLCLLSFFALFVKIVFA